MDVPLLFEVKFGLNLLSYKLVVYCQDESEQIRRLMLRNKKLSENDAKLRIESQMSASQRLKLADYTIDNSKTIDVTRRQIKGLNEIFKNSKKYILIRLGFLSFGLVFLSGVILIPLLLSIFLRY